jgi:hypothetical protein
MIVWPTSFFFASTNPVRAAAARKEIGEEQGKFAIVLAHPWFRISVQAYI